MEPFIIPGRRRDDVNVDIAPLMDMVFILLIFFIVTATFTRETGVQIEKPKAESAAQLQQRNILIAITRQGTVHVNERQVEPAALQEILKQMLQKNPDREIVLMADQRSFTGLLVKVMDAANLAGAKKVSVAALAE